MGRYVLWHTMLACRKRHHRILSAEALACHAAVPQAWPLWVSRGAVCSRPAAVLWRDVSLTQGPRSRKERERGYIWVKRKI
jgi:hypothetical protein